MEGRSKSNYRSAIAQFVNLFNNLKSAIREETYKATRAMNLHWIIKLLLWITWLEYNLCNGEFVVKAAQPLQNKFEARAFRVIIQEPDDLFPSRPILHAAYIARSWFSLTPLDLSVIQFAVKTAVYDAEIICFCPNPTSSILTSFTVRITNFLLAKNHIKTFTNLTRIKSEVFFERNVSRCEMRMTCAWKCSNPTRRHLVITW